MSPASVMGRRAEGPAAVREGVGEPAPQVVGQVTADAATALKGLTARHLAAVLLAVVLLTSTAACDGGIQPGTVTVKGVVNNTSNNSKCYWISVRHDNGKKTKGCIALAKWRTVAEGDHWSGQ